MINYPILREGFVVVFVVMVIIVVSLVGWDFVLFVYVFLKNTCG